MDYEKKYKESMAKMSTFLAKHDGFTISKDGEMYKELSEIFPELKESDDERIRKELIKETKGCEVRLFETVTNDEFIAWLERQGNNMGISEATKQELENNLHKALEKETPESLNEFLDKQGVQKPTEFDDTNAKRMFIKALERVEELNNKGYKLTDCDKNSWWKDFKIYCSYTEMQKPADKVEPKFKVGDWIITPENKVLQITSIEGTSYRFNNVSHYWEICYCDEICRLWTIQDAKNGDILINWSNTAFIFKAIEDETVKFHIAYNEKWDEIKTPSTKLSHLGLPEPQFEFHPATKEQRDLLFQKMKEAGYEWDAKKKEIFMKQLI